MRYLGYSSKDAKEGSSAWSSILDSIIFVATPTEVVLADLSGGLAILTSSNRVRAHRTNPTTQK